MSKAVPGQRWISESEPELGLGSLLSHEYGRAEILFPATGEVRAYATANAPLRRIHFEAGDQIQIQSGDELTVDQVIEENGLLTYICGDKNIPENELFDRMSFSNPSERIISGRVDDFRSYSLRTEGLRHKAQIAGSPVRGFAGGRIDLIPHQLSIADEVTSRMQPRVLLADEVGLGKTIEACLILQRLHLTHRADRILILLPEPLVHQWFVELLRRFNLLFSLFDEERCAAIAQGDPKGNPFLDSQLVIASLDFASRSKKRSKQLIQAGWDLLIVDEAHHLEWTPSKTSSSYQLVEKLAAKTEALLLLTATPQQLGAEGHFARLRLLDPERYSDLEAFIKESEGYEILAKLIDRLNKGEVLEPAEFVRFSERSEQIAELAKSPDRNRESLASALLDTFGTGRVLFRNTREALNGFPERRAKLFPIRPEPHLTEVEAKLDWLADKIEELSGAKILLICRTRELVDKIADGIQDRIAVDIAQFHEDLTLIQRDRNAAFFAEKNGAQLLICSEIGSEGRNFQFAHNLILFDLPEDPELLEQRIGRLDRIGQSSDISIHVPYLIGSENEVLARWFHEGLGAFESNLHGATEIASKLEKKLKNAQATPTEKTIASLIADSQKLKSEIGKKLAKGHDRLLELNSSKPGKSAEIIKAIQTWDNHTRFEDYFLRLLDFFNLNIEDLDDRSYLITGNEQLTHKLPALPDEGMAITFDRARALSREDFHFASIDHPMLQGGLDTLLGSDTGNSAYAVWETPGEKTIFLEAYYVIECVAPPALHIDRFLPPTPVRLVLDHQGKNRSNDQELKKAEFGGGSIHKLLKNEGIKQQIIPSLIKKLDPMAKQLGEKLADRAFKNAKEQLGFELDRLQSLSAKNPNITGAEIEAMSKHHESILESIRQARPRLDAMRLIFKRPKSSSR